LKKLIAVVLAVILLAGCSTNNGLTMQDYRLEMKSLVLTLFTQFDRYQGFVDQNGSTNLVVDEIQKMYDETVPLVDKVKQVKLPSNFSGDFRKQHEDIVKMFDGYAKYYYLTHQYALTGDKGTLDEGTKVANEAADARDRAAQLINNILGADTNGNYKP
jgi:hypothetical protein